jgi:beta-glucosidase
MKMSDNNAIEKIMSKLSVEEKISLLSGAGYFHSQEIEEAGIPSFNMADGPHGLRKQEQDTGLENAFSAIEAVCFPTACATACSFDKNLLFELGQALGDECQAEDIAILLGPGVNIKRTPLCGRNFEYFSEDPFLSSKLAASLIQGLESKGVGACLKHFAVNNQETRRMSVSANVDMRTLREIYLASFEDAVIEGRPSSVMCSYNRVNGTYASENEFLLTKILRKEWGYDGLVISDWDAVNDRVKGLSAGLNLEMPGSQGRGASKILAEFKKGSLDEEIINDAVKKIVKISLAWKENHHGKPYDKEKHHNLAKKIESESIVLLKNDDNILPLEKTKKILFVGEFAEKPRFQGGGSSRINCYKTVSAVEAASCYANVGYVKGFGIYDKEKDAKLFEEAVIAAKEADAVVIFAGLSDADESEGIDREHMDLNANQNELIERIAMVQENTVVVLHNGSPVSLPWLGKIKGLIELYLGGQAAGEAVVDVLFGDVNPSGKLAETFPVKIEDNPSFLNFPGSNDEVNYNEGLFVGYRYYDKKKMSVAFPFGYGLSYTAFDYQSISLSKEIIQDTEKVTVNVKIKNNGNRKGKEVIQLYIAGPHKTDSPEKELKGFEKIELEPGETGEVNFTLNKRSFAHWDTEYQTWRVFNEKYTILAGSHSRNLPLKAELQVTETGIYKKKFHINSIIGEVLQHPAGKELLHARLEAFIARTVTSGNENEDVINKGVNRSMLYKMLENFPLRGLISTTGGKLSEEMINALLKKMNEE